MTERHFRALLKGLLYIGTASGCLSPILSVNAFTLIIAIVCGLFYVIQASDWLEKSAKFFIAEGKVSPLFLGFSLLAVGTSLGEFCVSAVGTLFHAPDLVISNVTGSNGSNIAILGICAAIIGFQSGSKLLGPQAAALTVSALALYVAIEDGLVQFIDGWLLLGLGGVLIAFVYHYPKSSKDDRRPDVEILGKDYNKWTKWALFGVGAVVIGAAATVVVHAGQELASLWQVPEDLIGGTFVALGTSLPELSVSLRLALRAGGYVRDANIPQAADQAEYRRCMANECRNMALGNLVGSNILNICLVLGVPSLWYTFPVSELAQNFHVPAMVGFTVVLAAMMAFSSQIGRRLGLILSIGWLALAGWLYVYVPIS